MSAELQLCFWFLDGREFFQETHKETFNLFRKFKLAKRGCTWMTGEKQKAASPDLEFSTIVLIILLGILWAVLCDIFFILTRLNVKSFCKHELVTDWKLD